MIPLIEVDFVLCELVIQRVKHAKVEVDDQVAVGAIDHGLVVLLGIELADTLADVLWTWLLKKVTQLRIFSDCERSCHE